MIYTVAAVIFLHIISLPIAVSVFVDADSDVGRGEIVVKLFFIPVFKKTIDTGMLESALSGARASEENAEVKQNAAEKNAKLKAYVTAFGKRAITRVRVRELDLTARIGTGNAAASAMTVGALRVAFNRACTVLGYVGDAEIEPDYGAEILRISFSGIFSLCIADTVYTACGALFDMAARAKRSVASGRA